VPLAYLLAHGRGAFVRVLTALVALPLALPPLMSGLLLLFVLGPYTTAGRLFGGSLTDTRVGIVLAQTFVAAPFLIIAARAAFLNVDPALEDVAATLGHGPTARFRRVAVPSASAGIAAGILLAWLRAFGEFGATVILAYHPYSLPVFTFVQFDATGLDATMVPIAAALAAALVVLLLVQLPIPRRRRAQTAAAAPHTESNREPALLDFAVEKQLGSFSLDLAHQARTPHLALLGPSGAGKTLTLRLLAGLTSSTRGHVRVGSREIDGPGERRGLGYVPQQPALLPRRTVWQQVTFGVYTRASLAAWWIERLGLKGLEDRFPDELSGGQQRRVSLARTLANNPRVLLLDEPFTGLDSPVRHRITRELRTLQREAALSTILVTHDPEEAALLGEEILVIDDGHLLQAGRRETVFARPSTPQVAALLGNPNVHEGIVLGAGRLISEAVELLAPTAELADGSAVSWSVRPERILIDPAGHYHADVLDVVDVGSARELRIALESSLELTLRTHDASMPAAGQRVRVGIASEDVAVWPQAAGTVSEDARAETA
jgi:ABC-type Fe3+/spermidine/putrescine transport system ATPase subunit/ABC-type molybdate transport system permease subunit